MTNAKRALATILTLCAVVDTARAQLPLPGRLPTLGDMLGQVPGAIDTAADTAIDTAADLPGRAARTLADARAARIGALVRAHPDQIAIDPDGFAARAGEVVVDDADDALVAKAVARGYAVIERGDILGVGFARLATPPGLSLTRAIRGLRSLGAKQVSADQLHAQSAATAGGVAAGGVTAGDVAASDDDAPKNGGAGPMIGIIDGGTDAAVSAQRGFATGAPRVSDHGNAVASLIVGRGVVRGAAPAARLHVADVYGTDPAGGNAVAIAKALGWLVTDRVPVVTISLVGPPNPLLARVVAVAQARGTIIVAAVGNDGPAAPPGYPASYPGVIAVTAVDARGRVLIEAGHATHLDYAAPGADMMAANAAGRPVAVRGTSFAAPIVAATIALAYPQPDTGNRARALKAVDAAAKPGARYGRGLLCGACRTSTK